MPGDLEWLPAHVSSAAPGAGPAAVAGELLGQADVDVPEPASAAAPQVQQAESVPAALVARVFSSACRSVAAARAAV